MLKCLILTHYKSAFGNRMIQTHSIFGSTIDNTVKYTIMITLHITLLFTKYFYFILFNVHNNFKVGRNVCLNYV